MKREFRALSIALLAVALAAPACNKSGGQDNPGPEEPDYERALPDVETLAAGAGVIKTVSSSKTISIADGVSETDLSVTLTNGFKENIFIVTADLRRPDICARVAVSSNMSSIPTGGWPRQTLSRMAGYIEDSQNSVLAMINADFWNTSTFIPRGPVHCDGFVMNSKFDPMSNKQGITFVSCSSEDEMNIDFSASYTTASYDLPNVTGSGSMLVLDGEIADNSWASADDRHPRTAIGYSADGFVFFFCVDGRDAGVSEGMHYDEMGSILKAIGCVRAVNLDGGGSTQMLARNPSSSALEIRNKPSDGSERAVVNAWAIMKKL